MNKKYNIIYADPPWQHSNANTGGSMSSGASQQYSVMSVKDIAALNVRGIASEDSFLFMWWLASMPQEALHVVKSWGFELKTMTCFSWVKQTVNGKDHFGMGYYSRQQQEHVLIAKRGNPKVFSHSVRQNIYAQVREHSQKPEETRERIIELAGNLPRIELFARDRIEGWDAWGNEIENDNIDLKPIYVGVLLSHLK